MSEEHRASEAAGAEGGWIVDVLDADFEREVVERSHTTPVLVDFWAPWCGPCRTLGPLLERLAQEHQGAFVLAKVDSDEAPRTAQMFNVRSIPTVIAFSEGGIAGEFVGAQPERVVRQLLARVLPTPADELAAEAGEAAEQGDTAAAEAKFRAALGLESNHARSLIGLARVLGQAGDRSEALDLLERVTSHPRLEAEAERLAAELRTLAGVGDQADDETLHARIADDPRDAGARLALGRRLASEQRYEEALAVLIEAVRCDPGFEDGAARKTILDIFALLGADDPLTPRFRSELAKALYR